VISWLKVLHIASLSVWVGGLMVMPLLFAERPTVAHTAELYRLQRFSRYAYVQIISPAAFVAIATGIALIFAREVFTGWMALKLGAVGVLVLLHLRAGHLVQHIFEPRHGYAGWRPLAPITAIGSVALAILWLVLSKPPFEPAGLLPAWMVDPGGLQRRLDAVTPIP
jgi:putative membrane protein